MAIHGLLAALVRHSQTDVDPIVVENIWVLAERFGDKETMVEIISRPGPVPAVVLTSARNRKEVNIRVAYLCRTDLDGAERMTMLSAEKRSEVFAGLLRTAKDNTALADRIVEQFRAKPTKVLAKTLLRESFEHDSIDFDCLEVVAAERNMPDWLSRSIRRVATRHQSDATKSLALAKVLPPALLAEMELTELAPDAQLVAIDRLSAFAEATYQERHWETRYTIAKTCRGLIALAAVETLDSRVIDQLDALSTAEWLEEGEKLASLLAGRKTSVTPVNDQRSEASTATGPRLAHLLQVALSGNASNANLLLGLLENTSCWALPGFEDLLSRAGGAALVKAMHVTRSDELMTLIWRQLNTNTPEGCWEFVTDSKTLVEKLINETVTQMVADNNINPYGFLGSQLTTLLGLGVTDDLVASLPFSLLNASMTYWRYNAVIEATAQQIMSLQIQHLGSDQQAWENFNHLAGDWSGSLGELLATAKTL